MEGKGGFMENKNPEHISSILKRVLAEIQKKYEEKKAIVGAEQVKHKYGH